MANIIVLKKWREQHPGRGPVRLTGGLQANEPATLLMYTGVRYERHDVVDHRALDLPVRAEQN